MVVISNSEQDTFELGKKLGQEACPGDIVCLNGELGVGKTVFTAGFAEGLGISEPVCSPTFTLVQVYEDGRLPLYHFDVYRIEDPDEMYEIGFDEYLFAEGVCLIEWGEKVREILPETTKYIEIKKVPEKGFDYREIYLS